jgi:hypothetical protein
MVFTFCVKQDQQKKMCRVSTSKLSRKILKIQGKVLCGSTSFIESKMKKLVWKISDRFLRAQMLK